MSEQERRRYPRFQGGAVLAGRGPDGEVRGPARDQGPGGAFLETTEPIRVGSMLILTVHDPFERDQPVLLLARVARWRDVPPAGVGIVWKKAICAYGVARLKQFLEQHFHRVVDPHKTGAFAESELSETVIYDFEAGTTEPLPPEKLRELEEADAFYGIKFGQGFLPKAQYLEVRLVAAGADAGRSRRLRRELAMDAAAMLRIDRYAPGEVVTQPIAVEDATTPGMTEEEMVKWKYEIRTRKKTLIPTTVSVQGETVVGEVRYIERDAILVVLDGVKPELGSRVVVELPLTVDTRSCAVAVVGQVRRVARERHTRKVLMDVKVESVDERDEEGLFHQYLLAL